MYYNNEIKNKYFAYIYVTDVRPAQGYFEKFKSAEQEKGKDIALFTEAEWFDFLKSIDIIVINKVKEYTEFVQKYARWYFKTLKPEQENAFDNITKEDMIAYTSDVANAEKAIPRALLLKLLSGMPNVLDQFTVLAIYEGISGDEFSDIVNLKITDIDEETQTVHLPSGNDIAVSREFVELALAAEKQTAYIAARSPFSSKKPTATTLEDTDYIFRMRDNAYVSEEEVGKRVYRRFNTYKEFFENREFSIPRIMKSGLAHALLTMAERRGVPLNTLYDDSETREIMNRFGHPGDVRYVIKQMQRTKFL